MATQRSLGKLFVGLIAVLLVAGTAARWWPKVFHSSAPPYMDQMQYGIYLQGNDIESKLAVDAETEEQCSRVCLHETRCKAMSFAQHQWGGGVCQIKDRVPPRTEAVNAISAVKVFPP